MKSLFLFSSSFSFLLWRQQKPLGLVFLFLHRWLSPSDETQELLVSPTPRSNCSTLGEPLFPLGYPFSHGAPAPALAVAVRGSESGHSSRSELSQLLLPFSPLVRSPFDWTSEATNDWRLWTLKKRANADRNKKQNRCSYPLPHSMILRLTLETDHG